MEELRVRLRDWVGGWGGGVCLALMWGYIREAQPCPLFALLNTQYPSPSLFLGLCASLATFTCTMSAQPSETPADRLDPCGERRDGREADETRESGETQQGEGLI